MASQPETGAVPDGQPEGGLPGPGRQRVYLAARYSRRLELCGYRGELAGMGIPVTSRWLNGGHQLDNQGIPITEDGERRFEVGDPSVDHLRAHFAAEDLTDVLAAGTLVAFTEEPRSGNSRGGRHVELGIALGTGRHRVVVVGPRENVFCWLPEVEWYPDWAHLVMAWAPEFTRMAAHDCGPDERCFDCAADEELAAAIPPWPSMGGDL